DRCERGDVLPLAPGVRRFEERPGQAAEGSRDGEHPAAACGVRSDLGQVDLAGGGAGKLLSPPGSTPCVRPSAQRMPVKLRDCSCLAAASRPAHFACRPVRPHALWEWFGPAETRRTFALSAVWRMGR